MSSNKSGVLNTQEKERIRIPLPSIRDDETGYDYLSKLVSFVMSKPESLYIFDFSRCSTITHNGLVVLGGICNYLKRYEAGVTLTRGFGFGSFFTPIKVSFDISGMNSILKERLQVLGFWNYVFPDHGVARNENYIGYREHETVLEDSEIIAHLQDGWLTDEKVSLSEALKGEIISSIYEVFVNAYGHGLKDNPNHQSVISCGYYEPKEKSLSLSVLDLGGGIVNSVQSYTSISSKEAALKWALEVGNSTRTDSPPDVPRGLGFGILKDFIMVNGGVLRICTDSYMATIDSSGRYITEKVSGCIGGTLVSITVRCDDKHYRLVSEDKVPTGKYF